MSGAFAQYPSIPAFLDAEEWVLRNGSAISGVVGGDYAAVRASASGDLLDQMAALGDSPWDAGRYVSANPAYLGQPLTHGSALHEFWEQLRMSMLEAIYNAVTQGYTNQRIMQLLDSTTPGSAASSPGVRQELEALKAQVAAIPASSGGTVDLSGVTASLAAIATNVAAIKAKTDKDLA